MCWHERRQRTKSHLSVGEMAQSIKRCKGVINDTLYENIATSVIKNISTTKANTKQFAEYLTKIELWAVANGFKVTTPQELEWVR